MTRCLAAFPTRRSFGNKLLKKILLNRWFQLALSILAVASGQLFLKRGAVSVEPLPAALNWTGLSGLASPLVWLGIALVALSFVSWLYVLRFIPLAIAFPISQIVHVLVPIGSWIFLGELISMRRWSGIALVIVGIFLVAKSVAQMEEKL